MITIAHSINYVKMVNAPQVVSKTVTALVKRFVLTKPALFLKIFHLNLCIAYSTLTVVSIICVFMGFVPWELWKSNPLNNVNLTIIVQHTIAVIMANVLKKVTVSMTTNVLVL